MRMRAKGEQWVAPVEVVEDIFVAGFCITPFLNRDASKPKQSCFDDPNANPFSHQRFHIVHRRPAVAILAVLDFEDILKSQLHGALDCIIRGTDPRDGTPWGLSLNDGYSVEIAELDVGKFGLPHASQACFMMMARHDCGGADAAQAAAILAKDVLSKALDRCTVEELLFSSSDQSLQDWKKEKKKTAIGRKEAKHTLGKQLAAECKRLGMKGDDAPYTDAVKAQLGHAASANEFVALTTAVQRQCLNIVYKRAQLSGADVGKLILDMTSTMEVFKEQASRDDVCVIDVCDVCVMCVTCVYDVCDV